MSCRCQGAQSNCITEPFNANFVRPLQYVRGVDDNGCVSYTPVTSFALNVQDTNTLDLAFANGIISGNVRISVSAGNQIQALADGLFVSSTSINVQDTPTVDLTLTPTNDLSADVNVSSQPGNAIQVLPDGLFVSSTSINVQDTPTVDLTLTAGNVLSANVNISAQTGNGLQVLADGLYIPSTSNPCLTNSPDLVNFPTNDLLVTYNANTGCLEQIAVPSERIVYGEPSGTGSPRADNLLYSPSDNFLRATVGPDFPMQNSFMLYGQNSNALGLCRSIIGVISDATIINSNFSFVNVGFSSANFIRSTNSVVVGLNLTSDDLDVNQSAVLFRNAYISRVNNSFVSANTSLVDNVTDSFISTQSSTLSRNINESLCISLFSNIPFVSHSSLIAVSARYTGTLPTSISYCHANVASVDFQTPLVTFSTLHINFVTLLEGGDNVCDYSFIACNHIDLRNTRGSVFIFRNFTGRNNTDQAPESYYSFVSLRKRNTNRVGPVSPVIRGSMLITSNVLPDSLNSLLISYFDNNWLDLQNSVCVANGLQVYDPSPPFNAAYLRNSLIVGQFHDVSVIPIIDSLTLIGSNLRAGTQTVFGVGVNAYAPPAVINAGGWRAYIADGSADNANYFQGWESAWRFRMFRPSTNYANDADAVNALNTAYGADPRNAVGTMVVALVAGNPAIFTWNGATFVRITV
jgi:hypothetical protein